MGESKCVIRDKANFLKKHEKEPVLPASLPLMYFL